MQNFCRILIIDDESILRHGLKHLCNWEEEQFCIAGEASNGEEALEMIEKVKPHIIVTDVVMPIIDGIELSKIVHTLYPDIKIIVLSSFSEFDYVRESFKHGAYDYLLKATLTSSNLLEILKKVRAETSWNNDNNPVLENTINITSILKELFNKQITSDNLDMDALSHYFTRSHFILLACNLDFIDYGTSISMDELKESISKLSSYYLAPHICANVFFENNYILLINFDEDTPIKVDVDKFIHNLRRSSLPVPLVSSNNFKGIENIQKTYWQVTELLPKVFYFHEHHLVSVNTLLKSSEAPRFDLNLFKSHIKDQNFEMAYDNLKIYFNLVKDNLALDDYSLKRFCQNIVYTTLNIFEELGFDVAHINNSKIRLFKEIDFAISLNDLEKSVFNILDQISSSIEAQAQENNSVLITQIKQYVEANYSRDISLTDISENLHINYYYMSSYFKAHTNENLSSYINKVKVEKAKILLNDKTIPIAHVSEMVGFAEHNYFSRVFKKYTKLTPTAYRRKVMRT